jgi:hypothetical protein
MPYNQDMEFRLPRQIIDPKIVEIVSREIRSQDLPITHASKKRLKELAEIAEIIARQGMPQHLICKKLPHKLGHGLFLAPDAKPIQRHELIAPYAGEVTIVPENAPDDTGYAFSPISSFHLKKEEQAYFDPNNRYHPRRLYSLKLDALHKGKCARFINHSAKPNVVACAFSTPKNNPFGLDPMPVEILYIAKKTIHPGEQLLVCYEEEEDSYWGALGIEPFPLDAKTFQLSKSLEVVRNKPSSSKSR